MSKHRAEGGAGASSVKNCGGGRAPRFFALRLSKTGKRM
jgi:hypothetical protein